MRTPPDDTPLLTCSHCDDEIASDDSSHSLGTETICETCYDSETAQCDRCDRRVYTENGREMAGDGFYCDDCYDDRGIRCEHCGDAHDREDGSISWDRHDEPYCESCRDNGYGNFTDGDDSSDFDDERIFSYDADVLSIVTVAPLVPTRRYFGFEIELCTDYGRYDAADIFLERVSGRGIVKADGSINSGGIELVSIPLPLSDLLALIADVLKGDALSSAYTDPSCGMHVHVSRCSLYTAQLARLVRLLHGPRNVGVFHAIADRSLTGHQFAAIDSRDTSWKSLHRPDVFPRGALYDMNRYSALNLSNTNTIEFRIFASTTVVHRAQANVEACAALLDFCEPAGRSIRETDDAAHFLTFVSERRALYPRLNAILSDTALPKAA